MTKEQKPNINQLLEPVANDAIPTHAHAKQLSTEQLIQTTSYYKAQALLKSMLDAGLISLLEFNKITLLNRKSFSPYLVEIMSEIR